MICCDGCEDWFHGKCVNITKAMGQQMEEQGIEWRCPNCVKKTKGTPKPAFKVCLEFMNAISGIWLHFPVRVFSSSEKNDK